MANDYLENPIILDTFTSDIDLAVLRKEIRPFSVYSIKWEQPAAVDHACVITDGSGRKLFNEVCVVAKDSKIQYFSGTKFDNLKIAAGAVDSGNVVIELMGAR